jgi:hypothetical protein
MRLAEHYSFAHHASDTEASSPGEWWSSSSRQLQPISSGTLMCHGWPAISGSSLNPALPDMPIQNCFAGINLDP